MKTIKHILIDIADNAYIAGLKRDKDSIFNLDQALKELEKLLLECKPEKKTKKDVPDPYEVGIHATIPVAQASGYNQALSDTKANLKRILK